VQRPKHVYKITLRIVEGKTVLKIRRERVSNKSLTRPVMELGNLSNRYFNLLAPEF